MGRRVRVEYAGATYHVFSRGNRRSEVYRSAEEYQAYLEDLKRLTREHGVEVLAFCLMPNHPHLCLRTTEGGDPLSVLMQRLTLRHARRFNWVHELSGHLNESRYKAQVVDSEQYLLSLVRYIHRNPVEAGMVRRAEDWPYSSHHAYRGEGFRWVSTREVLWRVGGRAAYERIMGEPQDEEAIREFEEDDGGRLRHAIGQVPLERCGRRQVSPWSGPRPEQPVRLAAAEAVARLGLTLEELAQGSRQARLRKGRRALARALRQRGYLLHEIAGLLHREESAISRMLARASQCSEEEARYGVHLRLAA